MTIAPPLSVCLIIIVSSLAKAVIVFCSEIEIFLLTFDFSIGSRGILTMFITKLSKSSSLPCGGKNDLFLTSDSSLSSQPSKNSIERILRVHSEISFVNSGMFELREVGVNFNPFSSNLISVIFNVRFDKLTISISDFVFAMDFCKEFVLGIK